MFLRWAIFPVALCGACAHLEWQYVEISEPSLISGRKPHPPCLRRYGMTSIALSFPSELKIHDCGDGTSEWRAPRVHRPRGLPSASHLPPIDFDGATRSNLLGLVGRHAAFSLNIRWNVALAHPWQDTETPGTPCREHSAGPNMASRSFPAARGLR